MAPGLYCSGFIQRPGGRGHMWTNCCTSWLILPLPSAFLHQIENASEVLITPLEKFRKEQIGAARVRSLQTLFLCFRVEPEDCSTSPVPAHPPRKGHSPAPLHLQVAGVQPSVATISSHPNVLLPDCLVLIHK